MSIVMQTYNHSLLKLDIGTIINAINILLLSLRTLRTCNLFPLVSLRAQRSNLIRGKCIYSYEIASFYSQ